MNKETAIQALKNDIPLTDFIRGVNKKINNYWTSMNFTHNDAPVVMVDSIGKRYAKLAIFEKSPAKTGPLVAKSVYCFYDIANGDLLKGSWKAPVANGVRGNVKETNVLDKFTEYGPASVQRLRVLNLQ
jgi:hypothetical protein